MTSVVTEQRPGEREQSTLVAELAHIRGMLEAFRDGAPPPPDPSGHGELEFEPAADRLTRLFGLTQFERHLMLLAASVELDGDIAALAADLQKSSDPCPTFGLALAVLPGGHWDAIAPRSPLRWWRLVEFGSGPTLASRPLRLDERVLHFLTGVAATDERLDGLVRIDDGATPLVASQENLAVAAGRTAAGAGARVMLRIDGSDVDARLGVAQALGRELGRIPLVVRAHALPSAGPELALVARLVDREALLLPGVPVVDVGEAPEALVGAFVEELAAPLVVLVGGGPAATGRISLQRTVPLPTPSEARSLWAAALGDSASGSGTVEEIAQHFRLSAAAIYTIAREFLATVGLEEDAAAQLRRLCRERARVPLDDLAQRIDPVATWEDLVLPPAHLELLHEIARHVRHRTRVYEGWGFAERTSRGLGITALFAGESGTGKTLAAEVLAGELGLDLYRIDLAATVSKYIGETEKNLRRLFDAAEASGAVLLFDEADALFGKRGEVKDGHDRYANLEVAYLLQRMESYRGLAILTTNLRSNVDPAFMRRLRFVVQFPFPDDEQRAGIWQRVFPAGAPLDGVTSEALARLHVSGGTIRLIALSAAFAAAEDGGTITPAHLLRAAQVEYAKEERLLTDAQSEGLR